VAGCGGEARAPVAVAIAVHTCRWQPAGRSWAREGSGRRMLDGDVAAAGGWGAAAVRGGDTRLADRSQIYFLSVWCGAAGRAHSHRC
jgi:hypothetical protein